MAKRDYYDILGVGREADDKAIKSAYRKLAMKFHPDRSPDNAEAEDKFREATEAYDVLKDDQKRAAYDRFGHSAFEQGGFGGGGGPGAGAGGFAGGGFSDIFDQMFSEFSGGAGGGRQRNSGGNDLRYDMTVSLDDAFNGLQEDISITVPASCDSCSGSGAVDGAKPSTCGTCGGAGRGRAQQGFFAVERTCHACQGMGQVISDPCRSCGGEGRVQRNKTLSVSIPAGVDTGTRIRLSGKGEAGVRGGPAGDLYIFVTVAPHQIFTRDGNNLYMKIPTRQNAIKKQQMQTTINSFRHIRQSFSAKVLLSRASHFSSSECSAFACCFRCIRLSAVARASGIKWRWRRHVDANRFVKCHLARPDHRAQ